MLMLTRNLIPLDGWWVHLELTEQIGGDPPQQQVSVFHKPAMHLVQEFTFDTDTGQAGEIADELYVFHKNSFFDVLGTLPEGWRLVSVYLRKKGDPQFDLSLQQVIDLMTERLGVTTADIRGIINTHFMTKLADLLTDRLLEEKLTRPDK